MRFARKRDYRDVFDVIWCGADHYLLPYRESKSDPQLAKIGEEKREPRRYTRGYTKRRTDFWEQQSKHGAVRPHPTHSAGQNTVEGNGHRRQQLECVSDDSHNSEGRVEEPLWPTSSRQQNPKAL